MKLVSWNVNGLRSVLTKGFFDFWRQEDPDILCLQETKSRAEQLAEITWPLGYTAHWNSARRPGYAGVTTFTRIPPLAVTSGIGLADHDGEGRVLTLEFGEFFLVNVYTPNSRRELTRLAYRTREWEPAFRAYLQRLEQRKPVIFCGDLNVAHTEIDLARPKANRRNAGFTDEERAEFRALLDAGFVDTFRLFEENGGHYTWWSYMNRARERNIGWRIDYFLVSPGLVPRIRRAFILPHVRGSDHCPVGIELE